MSGAYVREYALRVFWIVVVPAVWLFLLAGLIVRVAP